MPYLLLSRLNYCLLISLCLFLFNPPRLTIPIIACIHPSLCYDLCVLAIRSPVSVRLFSSHSTSISVLQENRYGLKHTRVPSGIKRLYLIARYDI
ncbi:uncharacterized protein EI90DRAFT_290851 [Cantharellus anzutake]|uniref:uncharacterized protein n=1 Tax=Cantharellus anzutake TaxID=1750568 RepID=UPI0019048ABF|nr:uncharacterized protein EI90DRAFT_290851 [Cantharellus anzutake]KAF8316214.1 hypothetical protein EI90DRAFT_290851 [Cantharellus anzutake]